MFQKIITFSIVFIAALFQVTLLPIFFPTGIVPDLALILAVIWTIENGFERNLRRIIGLGLFLDIFSFYPIGVDVVSFLVMSFAIDILAKRLLVSSRTWRFMFMFLSVIVGTIVYYSSLSLFSFSIHLSDKIGSGLVIPEIVSVKMLMKILYNMILSALIYWPIVRLERFMTIYNHDILSQKKSFRRL